MDIATLDTKINIMSIFFSISGEVNMWPQGTPVIFIRFASCNLNCHYCDTKESINAVGRPMSPQDILATIGQYPSNKVIITGGEPLLQRTGLEALIYCLVDDYEVAVETNGSLRLDLFEQPDCWVVDIKMPSSLQAKKMVSISGHLDCAPQENLIFKIPVENEADVVVAVHILKEYENQGLMVALSAVSPLSPAGLWDLMLKYGLTWCILNTQIHKMICLE